MLNIAVIPWQEEPAEDMQDDEQGAGGCTERS